MDKVMDSDNKENLIQEIIDFNKYLDTLKDMLPSLNQSQKEELAENIAKRKKELGLE